MTGRLGSDDTVVQGAYMGTLWRDSLRVVGFLTWQLKASRVSVIRNLCESYKSYDVTSEVPACQFCCILLAKQITKSSPDLRQGELDYLSGRRVAKDLLLTLICHTSLIETFIHSLNKYLLNVYYMHTLVTKDNSGK